MSAPPPRPPNVPNGAPGTGAPPIRRMVKKSTAGAFPSAFRKQKPKPLVDQPPPRDAVSGQKGSAVSDADRKKAERAARLQEFRDKMKPLEQQRKLNNGWSEPPPPGVTANHYKLVTTKKALLEGIRYHAMRFNRTGHQTSSIDPTNQEQFPRPVTLHRRDRNLPPMNKVLVKEDEEEAPVNPQDAAEAERLRQIKADREAQRARDQQQIAPVMKANEPPKPKNEKKERAQTYYAKEKENQKKEKEIHYEETLPWHIEDADGKQVWYSELIREMSDIHVAFVIDGGAFRMIPLQRYYKFLEKRDFQRATEKEVDNMLQNGHLIGRWARRDAARAEAEKEKSEYRKYLSGGVKVKRESATSARLRGSEKADDYDIDMEGEEFQDDDENMNFDADDEDSRETKDRMRRDQLKANMFGEGDEDEAEREQKEEEKEKLLRKKLGKQTIKGLTKHEHALDYAADSDSEDAFNNPFVEESESESEEEKEEDAEKAEKVDDKKPGSKDQTASGANTKGNTTPSGSKKVDALKKGKSLKRPGSPNLSESSGNESTTRKKKVKTAKGPSSLVPSRSTTPLPGAKRGGAASDAEATAGEGSDGGSLKPKPSKLKVGTGATGTPSGSRATSPAPAGAKSASPVKPSGAGDSVPHAPNRIRPAEIIEAVKAYPKGVKIADLFRQYRDRIDQPGHLARNEWIVMVKQNCYYDNASKLMFPKTPENS